VKPNFFIRHAIAIVQKNFAGKVAHFIYVRGFFCPNVGLFLVVHLVTQQRAQSPDIDPSFRCSLPKTRTFWDVGVLLSARGPTPDS